MRKEIDAKRKRKEHCLPGFQTELTIGVPLSFLGLSGKRNTEVWH
jgi:hypothetical protein